ncbi:replication factor C subunit 4 [Frankliniella occidentalis]|uniref:Replication factor C subunit 2 n=1 Tax=Frankliniella occidentalis TaxID=133901 RepID=A0A6J1SKL1_FRAOC|nr:replication factor C subunit 4 [Frankliniella occidentalis]
MQSFLKTGKLGSGSGAGPSGDKQSGKGQKRGNRPTPWVEKYRPKTVDDVVEQGDVVEVLRQCLSGADLPNLLLYGPPGTGKTSTILAAARQLFGDMYRDRILELNASDERGIQIIRDKVKSFAQLSASGIRPDGKPCPAFKIVILDEADSMTHAAQAALRRTMEKQTRTTRFCLVCNYVSRIIQPLTSRCTKFRFKPLGEVKIIERLQFISSQENVNIEQDALQSLIAAAGGDLRRAITCLQSCARLKGKDDTSAITPDDVVEVMGVIPSRWIDGLMSVSEEFDYYKVTEYLDQFIMEGYSAGQLLEQLHLKIVMCDTISDKHKATICEKLAVCAYRLQEGASEYLQMADLCCTLMLCLRQ